MQGNLRQLLFLLAGCCAMTGAHAFPDKILEAFNEARPALALEEAPEVAPAAPRVHHHGEREKGQVALTFDACSTWAETDQDPRIPALLRESETPATLFLGGLWMAEFPELTRTLDRDPLFELGNHAWSHPDLTEMDEDEVRMQLGLTQLMAEALTGDILRWFRPPYVRKDETIVEAAAALGMETVQYDIASGDADESLDGERIARNVLEQVQPGSIVVLHMNNPDLPTAEALPLLIEGLEERGLEPVTMSELLDR